MNQRDDSLPDFHTQLLRAIGDEPAMASMPADDLARGRRLLQRRRFATATVAATTVPALAFGGWGVAASLGGSPTSGVGIVAPAESSSISNQSASECALARRAGGRQADDPVESPGRDVNVSENKGKLVNGPGLGSAAGQPHPADGAGCETPITTPEIERVTDVLREHADPDGTHTGDSLVVSGSMGGEGDETAAIYVSMDWVGGDQMGAVGVSLEHESVGPPDGQCQDQSMPSGPDVTCENHTLADGVTVVVGRGVIDAAQRLTVRFDRPDGTVVIATADAATERWWTDRAGAGALAGATVGRGGAH
jgi:hypothetical protein